MNRKNLINDDFIERYMTLVVSIANRYKKNGVPLEDLIQEGSIGILEAHERFDPTKGTEFSTYAVHWIKKRILQSLEREIRTSLNALELNDNIRILQEQDIVISAQEIPLSSESPESEEKSLMLLKEGNSLNEISEILGISRERARQLKQKALRRLKIDRELTVSLSGVNSESV